MTLSLSLYIYIYNMFSNESPKWNDKLEFQRQTGFYPPPSSHPVALLASQSSSTQKTMPNHPRLAAICPSKPSSPNARSKSACDNALGKGLTTMPVMSAWHGRHLKPALNLPVSSGGWQPAWKNVSSKQALCVLLYNSKPQVRQQGITSYCNYIIMIHDDTSYIIHKNSFSLWPESRATTIQHLGWKKPGFKGRWDMPRSTTSRPKHVFISKQKVSLAT